MTIIAIPINDLNNPVEIQTWLNANPNITIIAIWNDTAIFYIVYS